MGERRVFRADRSLDKPCEAAIWDGIAPKGLRAEVCGRGGVVCSRRGGVGEVQLGGVVCGSGYPHAPRPLLVISPGHQVNGGKNVCNLSITSSCSRKLAL